MGKKKGKKDKKGMGAEKTAIKTEKKAAKKVKKQLEEQGEEDIEAMIAEFQEKDRKKLEVVEEKVPPPSPRCNMTLTPHPDKDELVMFGGEYFNGNKTFMYNDLLFFNVKTREWTQVKAPNTPPPRCSHQAVALRQGGGQLWVFGGEFASPTQSQFYHYKDLWVYHFKDKKWEKIRAPGGPSARSGHRMTVCRRQIIVFGGFHDNTRDYRYFNDVYAFDLDTFVWCKLQPTGGAPSPRSGCQLAVTQDQRQVILYGGYSKEQIKKDVDQGKVHTDMFILAPEDKNKDDTSGPTKWKWTIVKQHGTKPSPRCGFSLAVTPGNRAFLFGGVFDEDEDEETVNGVFFNEMYSLELDSGKWHEVLLRGRKDNKEKKKRRKKKEKPEEGTDDKVDEDEELSDEDMEDDLEKLTVDESATAVTESPPNEDGDNVRGIAANNCEDEDDIFTVTVGPQSSRTQDVTGDVAGTSASGVGAVFMPCPRMNALLAVKQGTLYLFGGVFEVGDKQFTLSDMYSLDLHRLDEWQTIIERDPATMEWEESSSSSEEDAEDDEESPQGAVGGEVDEDEEDEEEDEESDMDQDAPEVTPGESVTDYFGRCKDFWLQNADNVATKMGMQASGKQLKKAAFKMAEEHFTKQSK